MGNSQEHVRFETNVLTLRQRRWEASPQYYYGSNRVSVINMACRPGIVNRGWDLPGTCGSKIVLVFTTEPTEGASLLRDGVDGLAYAGFVAYERLSDRDHALCRAEGYEPRTLYWWPEIVE